MWTILRWSAGFLFYAFFVIVASDFCSKHMLCLSAQGWLKRRSGTFWAPWTPSLALIWGRELSCSPWTPGRQPPALGALTGPQSHALLWAPDASKAGEPGKWVGGRRRVTLSSAARWAHAESFPGRFVQGGGRRERLRCTGACKMEPRNTVPEPPPNWKTK